MISHKELLKRIAQFMTTYLPDQTVQVLRFAQLNSRDLLIKMIPALRSMKFVIAVEMNYSVYWKMDLSEVEMVKYVLTEKMKDLCKEIKKKRELENDTEKAD